MRHKNSVKQLGKTYSHRKAMLSNMATSLVMEERIVTTKQKAKVIKRISEKLITRAKKNLELQDSGKKLHNKREVMKIVKDRDAIAKLFDTIALRFKDRNGGYTRMYLLGKRRDGDAAEMAILEYVVKEKVEKKKDADKPVKEEKKAKEKASKKEKTKEEKSEKKDKKKDK